MSSEQEKLKSLSTHLVKDEVDEHDIATVLARWTGIPVEKLQTTEAQRLLLMDQELKQRVIGQDNAIDQEHPPGTLCRRPKDAHQSAEARQHCRTDIQRQKPRFRLQSLKNVSGRHPNQRKHR